MYSSFVLREEELEGHERYWGSVSPVPCWGNTGLFFFFFLPSSLHMPGRHPGARQVMVYSSIPLKKEHCHLSLQWPTIWDPDDLSNHLSSNHEYFVALVSETDSCVNSEHHGVLGIGK